MLEYIQLMCISDVTLSRYKSASYLSPFVVLALIMDILLKHSVKYKLFLFMQAYVTYLSKLICLSNRLL